MGLLGYALVGTLLFVFTEIPAHFFWLPLVLHLVFMQALSLVDMVKPALVVKATSLSPAVTQGCLLFAIAGGYAVGTYSGGLVADLVSLDAVFVMVAGAGFMSLVLAIFTLQRLER
jgi:predicted MFS family arabinose efflux permease